MKGRDKDASSRFSAFHFVALLALFSALPSPFASSLPLDFPDHAQAARINAGIASSAAQAWRPSDVAVLSPAPGQPFYWAYLRSSPASPSVGSQVSNRHPPAFYWIWGESHVSSLEWDEPPACGSVPDHILIEEAGQARLEGAEAAWTLSKGSGGEIQSVSAPFSPSSPNPLTDALSSASWSAASVFEGPNGTALFPRYLFSLSGTVRVPYWQTEERHELVKKYDEKGNLASEECRSSARAFLRDYSMGVGAARSYGVESGPPLLFKFAPADGEQLSLRPSLDWLAASARRPSNSSVLLDGARLASISYASYALETDAAGFAQILRIERPGQNATSSFDSPSSTPFSPLLQINSTSRFLAPAALDANNGTCAYQSYHRLAYPFPLGAHHLSVVWQDEYGDFWQANWTLMERAQTGIRGADAVSASAVVLDARAPPAAPERQIRGPLPSAHLPFSDFQRGADAYFIPSGSLPLLAGGVLGLGLAVFFFLILRRR